MQGRGREISSSYRKFDLQTFGLSRSRCMLYFKNKIVIILLIPICYLCMNSIFRRYFFTLYIHIYRHFFKYSPTFVLHTLHTYTIYSLYYILYTLYTIYSLYYVLYTLHTIYSLYYILYTLHTAYYILLHLSPPHLNFHWWLCLSPICELCFPKPHTLKSVTLISNNIL